MQELAIFNNPEFGDIRTLETDDGKVLFCGKDVATALGYKDTVNALKAHCKKDGVAIHHLTDNLGRQQDVNFITEGNVYRLITHSKLPDAERFETWVFDEILPTIRKTGGYTINDDSQNIQLRKLEVQEQNAKTRMAALLMKMTAVETLSTEYKNILTAKAAEVLTGVPVLPPVKSEKTYSAGEIGQMFGVSAQKIGRIANEIGLKTDEFGAWYRDKSQHSAKEVDVFRYNEKAVERFKALLSSDDGEESA